MPSRYRTLTLIAWAAYALSFLLPPMHALPVDAGWKAFVLAVVMPFKPDEPLWIRGLCVAGVLANVAVALTPWKFRGPAIPRGAKIPRRWLVISLAAAFVLNIGWIPLMSDAELNVGYYLWIGSIGTLAVVAFLNHRRTEPS